MVLGDVFGPSDALVAVAAIGFVGTFVTSLITARRAKRTEQTAAVAATSAEVAAHNTQSNGHPDDLGHTGEPSPYDVLLKSHEYVIGLTHAVRDQAAEATRAAWRAEAAVKQNDAKTDALSERVEAGFVDAKKERGILGARLDQNVTNQITFVQGALAGQLELLGRVDALDGGISAETLQQRIDAWRAANQPNEETDK